MSNKLILNMVGEPCPIPVVKARRALENNEVVIVVVDNIIAVQNLKKMADGLKYTYEYTEISKDRFEVAIGGGKASNAILSEATANSKTHEYNQIRSSDTGSNSDFVVVISSNKMGVGVTISDASASDNISVDNVSGDNLSLDNKLGKILIKGYIFSLTELNPLPSAVIFLNSGAYLTAEGSNTVDDLKELESKGVSIMTCGTCSNYYGLKDKLAVGEVVDMYEISTRMANASKVINI